MDYNLPTGIEHEVHRLLETSEQPVNKTLFLPLTLS